MEQKAFFTLSYGVYLITSKNKETDGGCIANSFAQITDDPKRVIVTLQKSHNTTKLIQDSGIFTGSVLLEDAMDLVGRFGFQSGKDTDKFEGLETIRDCLGIKQVTKGIAATFHCKVEQSIDVGSHILFIGLVQDAKVHSSNKVLTYANYHKLKNASSNKESNETHGYRCTICNYIAHVDVLPEDYICPICKQPAYVFEKIES